jgi:hypothetical protein
MKKDTSSSLDEAKKSMAHWRATRTKRRPIPDQIWDTVLPLVNQYSYSTISKELGLSYQQITNKLATRKADPSRQQNTFVSVDLASTFFNNDQQKPNYKIALTKPNGISLVIDGATLNLISEIVANFVGQSC